MNKFFTYVQNSVGGNYDVDNNVAQYVIIEADTEGNADKKLDSIIGYNDYCECCGYRWQGIEDEYDIPSIYDSPVTEYVTLGNQKEYRIHYADGTITSGKIQREKI